MIRTDNTGLRFAIGCEWGGGWGEEDEDQTGQRSRRRREKESYQQTEVMGQGTYLALD